MTTYQLRGLILAICLGLVTPCTDMWTTDFSQQSPDVCPVKAYATDPDQATATCQLPFDGDDGVTYQACTVNAPNNPQRLPKCKTSSGVWMFCKVPTDAVIFGVTSRKAGATSVNGASTMGGTLLWITGF